MTPQEIKASIPRPELAKMTVIGIGLKIGSVFGKRVVVEPVVPKTKMDDLEAEGLLVIPKAAKKENTPAPSTGIVLVRGDQVFDPRLEPGAMVLFSKYGGMSVMIEGRELRVLDEAEIACTLEAIDGALTDIVKPVAEDKSPDVPTLAGHAIIR